MSTATMPPLYLELRRRILAGSLENAATQLSELSAEPATGGSLERSWIRLLTTRLAMKAGNPSEDHYLDEPRGENPSLRAEIGWVNGLLAFNLGDFVRGAQEFRTAATAYAKIGDPERELLSLYNEAIGAENLERPEDLASRIERFYSLRRLAHARQSGKLMGLIGRQLAMLYHQDGRLNAARDELMEAMPKLEIFADHSDRESAQLFATLLHAEAGEPALARAAFEKVLGPHEERHRFPVDFIGWKLGLRDREPRPEDYGTICPFFRFSLARSTWGQGPRRFDGESLTDLEGRLLAILKRGPVSRHYLCHALWPEPISIRAKRNRFYRLLNRLKPKLGDALVSSIEGIYSLRNGVAP